MKVHDGRGAAEAFALTGWCLSCDQQRLLWMVTPFKAPLASPSIHQQETSLASSARPFSNRSAGITSRAQSALSPAITFQ